MSTDEYGLVDDVLTGRMSRRDLIIRLMAAGVSLSAITGLLAESGIGGEAEAAELAAPAMAPKRGGTLRIGFIVPAASTDPVTLFNEGAILTLQLACEYLCYARADGSLEPKLATSWHSTKPDTWTFNLRKNVKWHNGKPFTADDVVYTFKLLSDPAVASAALSAYKGILSPSGVKKVDAHTVRFHLDRGYVDFPNLVSCLVYNSAILPKGYKVGDFVKGGIGTGPYILTKYTPKVGATYKRNPHYWAKGLPYLDAVQFKYYADQTSVVLAMQGGAIDSYPNLPYQGSQAIFGSSKFKILKHSGSSYREFHMRTDQKPFNDKRVRQAVALSLNRPALLKGLLNNLGNLGNDHAFAPAFALSAVTKSIPQRKQDYAQAKKLLAAAGYGNGFDATLTTEQYLEIPQYAVVAQQQLKAVGINLKLNIEDQNTYYGTPPTEPWLQVPMGIVDWAPRGIPSQVIDAAYLSTGVWNSAHWVNKTFDSLVNGSDAVASKSKRNAMVLKAAKIMHDEVPAIIAYWIQDLHATTQRVHNVKGPVAPYPDYSAVYLA